MKSILFAVLMLMASSFAFAGENEIYFETRSECQVAKTAKYYTPALKRPAPQSWKREALTADTCVHMDTVQGKFFVKLAKGAELAQNPKTGSWHHTLCTNWTDWKQPEQKVAEAPKACDDCNKTVEHTTTVIEKVVVQCANGTVIVLDGSEKKEPTAKCPHIKVESKVSSETKVETKTTSANCQGGCENKERATQTRFEARSDGKCFAQTNIGYKLEIKPERTGGRLMAMLVEPESNKSLSKPVYVASETTTRNAQGSDCKADLEKLSKNWDSVRSSLGLPSVCQVKS